MTRQERHNLQTRALRREIDKAHPDDRKGILRVINGRDLDTLHPRDTLSYLGFLHNRRQR